jgi:hypothetical protein
MGAAARTAFADEPLFGTSSTPTATDRPLLTGGTPFDITKGRSIFGSERLAATAQQATTATTTPNEHQFGVGVRLGGWGFGIGGSVRYFFYGGPLGVQAEVSRHGLDFGPSDFSSVQFAPAVIYRFPERTFDAPLSLTPYAGGGLSFIHTSFDDEDQIFGPNFDPDDTDVGVLLFGGVELFFERVPNLGVSGELTWNSNDDVTSLSFGSASLGGPAFTAAAHWYFW